MTRTLIVAPNWVGDAVMAEPLIARLKAQNPATEIDVLAPAWTLAVFARMAGVSGTLALPFGHGELALGKQREFARGIRGRYGHTVVLPNSLKSALIPWLAGIPKRTGFKGEFRYGLLNDVHQLDKAALPKMVERFAALAQSAGEPFKRPLAEPRLVVKAGDVAAALARYQLDIAKPVTALCPGAEFGPAKRWPPKHFAEVATSIVASGGAAWIFGSAKDSAIAAEIQVACGGVCVDLTGKTTLAEAIDLMSATTRVLTNDSGLMHVAAALDKPLLAIFGSSSPGFTPPLSAKARIVRLNLACSPCFKRECPLGHTNCLNQLSPRAVGSALDLVEKA
jgi:heptosyltransferase II